MSPGYSISFRVTCNRAGEKSRHSFSSMDAARALGAQINNIFGWRPDMKNFDMEVVLNIRNDTVVNSFQFVFCHLFRTFEVLDASNGGTQ